MTAHIDEGALRSSLQRLREAAFDADVAGVMKRTVDAVHGVFGYGGAGIMFITESGYLSYVAASDEAGRQLEEAQASAGQGPCYESYVYAREVVSSDVHADSRWPELRTRLSAQVRAVAGTPILLGGSPVGTLNVYRGEPVEWDKSDVNALTAYSGLIAGRRPGSSGTRHRGRPAAVRPGLPGGHRAGRRLPHGHSSPGCGHGLRRAAQAGTRFT